jgi:hypothetical protein
MAASGEGSLRRREQHRVKGSFDRTVEQKMGAEGHKLPSSVRPKPSAVDSHLRDSARAQSDVVRRAREVAEQRKRQLDAERER